MTHAAPQPRFADSHWLPSRPAAFTLVELMVVIVILAILASLTFSGLAGARDRSKADKTRSTLRKLDEIITARYESYLTRRMPQASSWPAVQLQSGGALIDAAPPFTSPSPYVIRIWGLRLLMALEMPDQWSDVPEPASTKLPKCAVTAPVRRYAAMKQARRPSLAYQGAECLAMMTIHGGFDPDAIEGFRPDELGDVDKDGFPEFLDGWGQPIGFIRWPVGWPFAVADASANPDPLDPMGRSALVEFPQPSWQRDYAVAPLLFSCGRSSANEALVSGDSASTPQYGGYFATSDVSSGASWLTTLTDASAMNLLASGTVPSTRAITSGTTGPGSWYAPGTARDNITNYDLISK